MAVAWTLFVWVGRIRNALADDELATGERMAVLVLCASFLVPTLALVVSLLRNRGAVTEVGRWLVVALLGWSSVFWAWRVGGLLLGGDRGVGFVVVHAVLAVVSVTLWAISLWAITDSSVAERNSEEIAPRG